MELKHLPIRSVRSDDETFNRTSMELKQIRDMYKDFHILTFNRTSMELKLTRPSVIVSLGSLLIEPVWN